MSYLPFRGLVGGIFLLCLGCDHEHTPIKEKGTVKLVSTYKSATENLVNDLGSNNLVSAKYPTIFFKNPGLSGWHGPYIVGEQRTNDYFGNPLSFVVTNNQIIITSRGIDGELQTSDDIKAVVALSGGMPH